MKKLLVVSVFLQLFLFSFSVKAIPAYPYPQKILQPDGSSVTLCMHGDEFMNFMTTEDGYTVVRNTAGYYVYAKSEGGVLSPTPYVAKDLSLRSNGERRYLVSVKKYLSGSGEQARVLRAAANADYREKGLLQRVNASDAGNFRGLVILVNFEDRKFGREDSQELFSNMMNKKDYDGFTNGNSYVECTGSVRDYFYDNSGGKFVPTFDVIGPIDIDYEQTYVKQVYYAYEVTRAVCMAVDDQVDFSDYDSDGDGVVDMVYFIFAGGGSNVQGNNQLYVWPHASAIMGLTLDGVRLGRYACSTELQGLERSNTLDGIGTVCHEFSHVLGLPDLYDTDYEKSGGETAHPGNWSVMASGSYLNQSHTPCGFSLYERYASGWATPRLIDGEGAYSLQALGTSNEGYRINSVINNEFFLIENRQQTGWDKYLPGHGMLVFRVDSTDVGVWENNKVNVNPEHPYYELIRAKARAWGGTVQNSGGDPFPGIYGVTSLTNETTPSLLSWTGNKTETIISDITEVDGVISFRTEADVLPSYVEDFEGMELTTDANATDVQGKFTRWTLNNAQVESPEGRNVNGERAVGMIRGSELITTVPVDVQVNFVSLMFWNPTQQTARVRLYYSEDGITWTTAGTFTGEQYATVSPGNSIRLNFNIKEEVPIVFKVSVYSGSTTEKCYLDDFTLHYDSKIVTGLSGTLSDGNKVALSTLVEDGYLLITGSEQDYSLYSANGVLIERGNLNEGKARLQLPQRGIYIVRCGDEVVKVVY